MNIKILVNEEFYGKSVLQFYNVNFKLVHGDLIIYKKYFIFFKHIEIVLSKDSWISIQNISY